MIETGRSKQQNILLILILGALNTITPFSIDMYLPAFPRIAADFNTGIDQVALSVSTYFLGYAIGQIQREIRQNQVVYTNAILRSNSLFTWPKFRKC